MGGVSLTSLRAGGRERGRPAGRGAVVRDQGFSASTRWGCSRTGPASSSRACESASEDPACIRHVRRDLEATRRAPRRETGSRSSDRMRRRRRTSCKSPGSFARKIFLPEPAVRASHSLSAPRARQALQAGISGRDGIRHGFFDECAGLQALGLRFQALAVGLWAPAVERDPTLGLIVSGNPVRAASHRAR